MDGAQVRAVTLASDPDFSRRSSDPTTCCTACRAWGCETQAPVSSERQSILGVLTAGRPSRLKATTEWPRRCRSHTEHENSETQVRSLGEENEEPSTMFPLMYPFHRMLQSFKHGEAFPPALSTRKVHSGCGTQCLHLASRCCLSVEGGPSRGSSSAHHFFCGAKCSFHKNRTCLQAACRLQAINDGTTSHSELQLSICRPQHLRTGPCSLQSLFVPMSKL